jgi:hypothetical protein
MLSVLNKKERMWAVGSAAWLIAVCAVSYAEAGRLDEDFWAPFLLIGMLPVVVGWGVRWVSLADEK